jgi:hypothetical protein
MRSRRCGIAARGYTAGELVPDGVGGKAETCIDKARILCARIHVARIPSAAFLASDYSSYLTGEVISVSSLHP